MLLEYIVDCYDLGYTPTKILGIRPTVRILLRGCTVKHT